MKPGTRVTSAPAFVNGDYERHLLRLRGIKASGVYVIQAVDDGEILYVGESHTGRLYDTITRHFRAWERPKRLKYANGRQRGGMTYDRARVLVGYVITSPADAVAAQYAEIQRLKPRDNEVACTTDRCSKRAKVDRATADEYKPQPTDAPF